LPLLSAGTRDSGGVRLLALPLLSLGVELVSRALRGARGWRINRWRFKGKERGEHERIEAAIIIYEQIGAR